MTLRVVKQIPPKPALLTVDIMTRDKAGRFELIIKSLPGLPWHTSADFNSTGLFRRLSAEHGKISRLQTPRDACLDGAPSLLDSLC